MKDERTKQFAYSFHAATDEHGFILGTIVTPGNIHDSHMLQPLVEKVIEKVKKPLAVAADAAYKTPAITKFLLENQMLPVLPYTRPKTKDGFFRKHDYIYDEHYDCYICPNNQTLPYVTTTKERSSFYVHFYPSFHFATLYLDENNETFPETLYNRSSLYDRRIIKMKSFEFKLYGGFTITFEKEHMEIDVKGVKGLFFQRVKPRHKAIRYDEIVKIDYKEAGYTVGYIRFVTPEIENYPSSQYVAEVDEHSIIFEKDEKEKFEEFMMYIHKKFPQIEKHKMKM